MHSSRVMVTILFIFNPFHLVTNMRRNYVAFVPTPANVKLNATPLSTLTEATPLSCMRACVGAEECRSFNMGPEGRCQLLMSYLCDGSADLMSEMGVAYYDVDVDTGDERLNKARCRVECREEYKCSPKCDHKLGSLCQNEADCEDVTGGTCAHGRCQCKAQFHYSEVDDACLKDCSEFANTFTVTRGYALPEYNDVIELSGHTLGTCMASCLNANFICRSFEFGPSAGSCLLSSNSCSNTENDLCVTNENYDYFSRDCL